MEERKEFLRQIGLKGPEAYDLANSQFDIKYYREKRHELRKKGLKQAQVDQRIICKIRNGVCKDLERKSAGNTNKDIAISPSTTKVGENVKNHNQRRRSRSPLRKKSHSPSKGQRYNTKLQPSSRSPSSKFTSNEKRDISGNTVRKERRNSRSPLRIKRENKYRLRTPSPSRGKIEKNFKKCRSSSSRSPSRNGNYIKDNTLGGLDLANRKKNSRSPSIKEQHSLGTSSSSRRLSNNMEGGARKRKSRSPFQNPRNFKTSIQFNNQDRRRSRTREFQDLRRNSRSPFQDEQKEPPSFRRIRSPSPSMRFNNLDRRSDNGREFRAEGRNTNSPFRNDRQKSYPFRRNEEHHNDLRPHSPFRFKKEERRTDTRSEFHDRRSNPTSQFQNKRNLESSPLRRNEDNFLDLRSLSPSAHFSNMERRPAARNEFRDQDRNSHSPFQNKRNLESSSFSRNEEHFCDLEQPSIRFNNMDRRPVSRGEFQDQGRNSHSPFQNERNLGSPYFRESNEHRRDIRSPSKRFNNDMRRRSTSRNEFHDQSRNSLSPFQNERNASLHLKRNEEHPLSPSIRFNETQISELLDPLTNSVSPFRNKRNLEYSPLRENYIHRRNSRSPLLSPSIHVNEMQRISASRSEQRRNMDSPFQHERSLEYLRSMRFNHMEKSPSRGESAEQRRNSVFPFQNKRNSRSPHFGESDKHQRDLRSPLLSTSKRFNDIERRSASRNEFHDRNSPSPFHNERHLCSSPFRDTDEHLKSPLLSPSIRFNDMNRSPSRSQCHNQRRNSLSPFQNDRNSPFRHYRSPLLPTSKRFNDIETISALRSEFHERNSPFRESSGLHGNLRSPLLSTSKSFNNTERRSTSRSEFQDRRDSPSQFQNECNFNSSPIRRSDVLGNNLRSPSLSPSMAFNNMQRREISRSDSYERIRNSLSPFPNERHSRYSPSPRRRRCSDSPFKIEQNYGFSSPSRYFCNMQEMEGTKTDLNFRSRSSSPSNNRNSPNGTLRSTSPIKFNPGNNNTEPYPFNMSLKPSTSFDACHRNFKENTQYPIQKGGFTSSNESKVATNKSMNFNNKTSTNINIWEFQQIRTSSNEPGMSQNTNIQVWDLQNTTNSPNQPGLRRDENIPFNNTNIWDLQNYLNLPNESGQIRRGVQIKTTNINVWEFQNHLETNANPQISQSISSNVTNSSNDPSENIKYPDVTKPLEAIEMASDENAGIETQNLGKPIVDEEGANAFNIIPVIANSQNSANNFKNQRIKKPNLKQEGVNSSNIVQIIGKTKQDNTKMSGKNKRSASKKAIQEKETNLSGIDNTTLRNNVPQEIKTKQEDTNLSENDNVTPLSNNPPHKEINLTGKDNRFSSSNNPPHKENNLSANDNISPSSDNPPEQIKTKQEDTNLSGKDNISPSSDNPPQKETNLSGNYNSYPSTNTPPVIETKQDEANLSGKDKSNLSRKDNISSTNTTIQNKTNLSKKARRFAYNNRPFMRGGLVPYTYFQIPPQDIPNFSSWYHNIFPYNNPPQLTLEDYEYHSNSSKNNKDSSYNNSPPIKIAEEQLNLSAEDKSILKRLMQQDLKRENAYGLMITSDCISIITPDQLEKPLEGQLKSKPPEYWTQWWSHYKYIENALPKFDASDQAIQHAIRYCLQPEDPKYRLSKAIHFKVGLPKIYNNLDITEDNYLTRDSYKLLRYKRHLECPEFQKTLSDQELLRVRMALERLYTNKPLIALLHQSIICRWHISADMLNRNIKGEQNIKFIGYARCLLRDKVFHYFVWDSIKELKKMSSEDWPEFEKFYDTLEVKEFDFSANCIRHTLDVSGNNNLITKEEDNDDEDDNEEEDEDEEFEDNEEKYVVRERKEFLLALGLSYQEAYVFAQGRQFDVKHYCQVREEWHKMDPRKSLVDDLILQEIQTGEYKRENDDVLPRTLYNVKNESDDISDRQSIIVNINENPNILDLPQDINYSKDQSRKRHRKRSGRRHRHRSERKQQMNSPRSSTPVTSSGLPDKTETNLTTTTTTTGSETNVTSGTCASSSNNDLRDSGIDSIIEETGNMPTDVANNSLPETAPTNLRQPQPQSIEEPTTSSMQQPKPLETKHQERSSNKELIVSIVTKVEYGPLSDFQITHIRQHISSALDVATCSPNFEKNKVENGILDVHCSNVVSLDWLTKTVLAIPPCEDHTFVVINYFRLRKQVKALTRIYGTYKIQEVLDRFQTQNENLNTDRWKVISYMPEKDRNESLLVVGLDLWSMEVLKSKYGMRPYLELGRVTFHIVKPDAEQK